MNKVFIATSLDGYIADKEGGIDWLHEIPNPDGDDMGYHQFIASVDAIVMGLTTFETVCCFDIPWPYTIPVFVLSHTLQTIPEELETSVSLVKGPLSEVLSSIHDKGYQNLYIDGGTTIQGFLAEDLIDEMTITTIPVLLGGGFPLFGELTQKLEFTHSQSTRYLDCVVQNTFVRKRN